MGASHAPDVGPLATSSRALGCAPEGSSPILDAVMLARGRFSLLALAVLLAVVSPGIAEILGEVTSLGQCADRCEDEPAGNGLEHCCTSLLRGCACSGVSPIVASALAAVETGIDSRPASPARIRGTALDGFAGEIFHPPAV